MESALLLGHGVAVSADLQFLIACSSASCASVQDYMSTRNAILDTYKANPQRLLDLEALQNLDKEPDTKASLSEIWAFLNDWGIINFKARAATPLPPDIGRQTPAIESQTRSDDRGKLVDIH